jgi:hypothetical protein
MSRMKQAGVRLSHERLQQVFSWGNDDEQEW